MYFVLTEWNWKWICVCTICLVWVSFIAETHIEQQENHWEVLELGMAWGTSASRMVGERDVHSFPPQTVLNLAKCTPSSCSSGRCQ